MACPSTNHHRSDPHASTDGSAISARNVEGLAFVSMGGSAVNARSAELFVGVELFVVRYLLPSPQLLREFQNPSPPKVVLTYLVKRLIVPYPRALHFPYVRTWRV